MYGIDGRADLPEEHARPPDGLRGSAPGARRQRRLRPAPARRVGRGARRASTSTRSRATPCPSASGRCCARRSSRPTANWREPDCGIWEVRGEPKHFTSSKLMCWVAMRPRRAAGRAARGLGPRGALALAADEIHADICANASTSAGVVHAALRHDRARRLPAAHAALRFLPPSDERIRTTVLAIADELTEDGLVLRYRVGETDDGLAGEEGTFTICSFWLVSALCEIGETATARATLCEKLLGLRQRPRPLRRGDRHRHAAATSATSRRPSRTSRSSTPSCT